MSSSVHPQIESREDPDKQYEAFKTLLGLWAGENPIKTNKLQVLLAVNALLVSAVSISGGFTADKWYVYAAGAVFSLIWTFSIGRTSLFQAVWQKKLEELRELYPNDPRFSVLDTEKYRQQAKWMLRTFGGIPSKWYLLFAPFGFALAWFAILLLVR